MIYAFSLLQGHFYLYMSLGISDIKVLTVKGCTTRIINFGAITAMLI